MYKNFYKEMSNGIVLFKYRKQNGIYRSARGTLNPDVVQDLDDEKREEMNKIFTKEGREEYSLFSDSEEYQLYFDVERGAPRQFYPADLIEWEIIQDNK